MSSSFTGDPADVDRVAAALVGLKKKLDSNGLVLEPELRTSITRARAGAGMLGDAVVYVVLAPPASSERLDELDAACQEALGFDLPADYRAFLARHDGMTVGELDAEGARQLAHDPTVIWRARHHVMFVGARLARGAPCRHDASRRLA